jgi:opacity protein-like surface antigen
MNTPRILIGCSALLVASAPAWAEEQMQGPYVGADLGVALTSDAKLREFPGAAGGSDVEFNPGVRLSLSGGWRFNDWLRAGGEFGIISHSIKGADASLTHFPLMANLEFQVPNKTRVVPFLGGGPGVSISVLDIDDDNLGGGDFVDGSTGDAVFAWQAYGGARFQINDSMSVGIVYKYFEAESSSWDVRRTSSDIRFGRTRTHSISASFSMDF